MNYDNPNDFFSQEQAGISERNVALYLARVMGWMCVGLFTTLVCAIVCLTVPAVFYTLYSIPGIFYGVIIAEIAVALVMSFAVNKLSPAVATVLFMVYSALTGVTFSTLFLAFELSSLIYVFGVTAFIFVAMAIYGFVTKRDLTRIGSLALFALLGIIVAGVANWFLRSSMLDFIVTCVGVVIFIILIAFDTQKVKSIYLDATAAGFDEEHPMLRKVAIYGAFTLYLDFINLFLKLLRLMGRRRS